MITLNEYKEYLTQKKLKDGIKPSTAKINEITSAAIAMVETEPAWSVIRQEIEGWMKSSGETAALMAARLTDGPILSPEAYADTKTVLAYNRGAAEAFKKILDLVGKH